MSGTREVDRPPPATAWALVSPFDNPTNPYNGLQKRLLAELGYQLAPFSLRTIFSPRVRLLFSRRNLVVLNWTEARAFRSGPRGARLSAGGLAILAFYLLVLLACRARVLYVVHNHAAQDSHGWQRRFSGALVRLLCRIADLRGVLDPTATAQYRAAFLPHPLLGERRPAAPRDPAAPRRFLIFGAIRRYKALAGVLEHWPAGLALDIVGRADPAYAAELQAIIDRRGLGAQVAIRAGFVDDDELRRCLAAADALILPHMPASSLVSSAFFESVGRVPLILARESPFNRWLVERFASVRCFADDAALARLALGLAGEATLPDAAASLAQAEALSGWPACVAAYAAALGRTRLGEGPAFGQYPKLRRPRISVVIPNHNYGRYLMEAIDSARLQDEPPAEVIVVDDGSTDDSRAVMARYGTQIVAIHREQGGQCAAVNDGVARATGEVVVVLDADDRLHAGALAAIGAAFDEGVAKVHWPLALVDARGQDLDATIPSRLDAGDRRLDLYEGRLYASAPGSGNAYRRAAIQPLLPLPLDPRDPHGADYFLIYGSSLLGRVKALPFPFSGYRVHARPDSLRFGNANAMDGRAARRALRLRDWLQQRLGVAITPPDPLRDFSVQKQVYATRTLAPPSAGARLREGLAALPQLLRASRRVGRLPMAGPLLALGWGLLLATAPRRLAERAALYVCNPAARGRREPSSP